MCNVSRKPNDHDPPAGRERPAGRADIDMGRGPGRDGHLVAGDEPPVVARLVVEIRSDGSRTIARGAVDDVATGQRVAIEARGDSPAQLAWALARSMVKLPMLAGMAKKSVRQSVRGLLPGRRHRGKRE